MIKRLATVIWWLGAMAGITGLTTFVLIANKGSGEGGPFLGACAFLMAVAWCLSFVLAGSFWRPPKS